MNLAKIIANPGIYTPPAETFSGVGLAVAIVATFIGCAVISLGLGGIQDNTKPAAAPGARKRVAIGFALILGGLIISGAGFVAAVTPAHNDMAKEDEAKDAHSQMVADWLDEEYGITATPEAAKKLTAGATRHAEYDGSVIAISIVKTVSGDLAVINGSGDALEPVGR